MIQQWCFVLKTLQPTSVMRRRTLTSPTCALSQTTRTMTTSQLSVYSPVCLRSVSCPSSKVDNTDFSSQFMTIHWVHHNGYFQTTRFVKVVDIDSLSAGLIFTLACAPLYSQETKAIITPSLLFPVYPKGYLRKKVQFLGGKYSSVG